MIANMRMDRFNSGFILAWCSFCFYYCRMTIFLVSGWCRSTITECVSPVKFLIASGGSYFCQCLYRTPTNLSILILQCLDQGIHSAYCPFSYLAIAAAPRTHPYWSSCNSCIRSGAASLAPSPIGPSAIAALASSSESRPWQSRYCYLDCFGCPILPNDSAVERRISSSWCPNFLLVFQPVVGFIRGRVWAQRSTFVWTDVLQGVKLAVQVEDLNPMLPTNGNNLLIIHR